MWIQSSHTLLCVSVGWWIIFLIGCLRFIWKYNPNTSPETQKTTQYTYWSETILFNFTILRSKNELQFTPACKYSINLFIAYFCAKFVSFIFSIGGVYCYNTNRIYFFFYTTDESKDSYMYTIKLYNKGWWVFEPVMNYVNELIAYYDYCMEMKISLFWLGNIWKSLSQW